MAQHRKEWPKPTTSISDEDMMEQLRGAALDTLDTFMTTDGCDSVEPDGICEHGHPTWLLVGAMI